MIENSIFALDNPNVWYELGYAYALGKDVVMFSDENRKSFPFDISHKSIIPYKTESPSDFEGLSESITKKIKSYISSYKTSERLSLMSIYLGNQISLFT